MDESRYCCFVSNASWLLSKKQISWLTHGAQVNNQQATRARNQQRVIEAQSTRHDRYIQNPFNWLRRDDLKILGEIHEIIRKNPLPKKPDHIAIIMDGNGRYAQQQGMDRSSGHMEGMRKLYEVIMWCLALEVKELTVFAFSAENWKRPAKEVNSLTRLFGQFLSNESKSWLDNHGVEVEIAGDVSAFGEHVVSLVSNFCRTEGMDLEISVPRLKLVVVVNTGGQQDVVLAAKRLCEQVQQGQLDPSQITPEQFESQLHVRLRSSPDLLIRTGGQQRLSNFILYYLGYTELVFLDDLWPELSPESFARCLHEFARRKRNFGAVL